MTTFRGGPAVAPLSPVFEELALPVAAKSFEDDASEAAAAAAACCVPCSASACSSAVRSAAAATRSSSHAARISATSLCRAVTPAKHNRSKQNDQLGADPRHNAGALRCNKSGSETAGRPAAAATHAAAPLRDRPTAPRSQLHAACRPRSSILQVSPASLAAMSGAATLPALHPWQP